METLLFIQTYAKTSTNEKMLFPMRHLCAKNGYDFRFIHAEKTDLKTAEEISKAAGVFITGKVDKDWIDFITGLGKSYVVIGELQYEGINTMSISYDWFAGIYGITERLIHNGCKRIIYCSSPDSFSPAKTMIKGYREAVVDGKLPYNPNLVLRINGGEYGKIIKPILLKEEFDGIICNNDCYPFLISLLYNMDFDRTKIKIGLLDNAWEQHLHETPMIDNLTMAYYSSVLTISSVKILLKKIADSSMKNRRFLIKPKFIEN
jgi:DNA-binding LacI/PurR family transcriptional regulator